MFPFELVVTSQCKNFIEKPQMMGGGWWWQNQWI